ncbi:MAG: J domain-containing protein [Bacteroidales bacterium]|nr:J domain-containing protein [Candidatus Scybalocola fimicaballi]
MEITDIDKKFISKYEEIDLDFVTIKAQIAVLGSFFIFSLIMIPINLINGNLLGLGRCIIILFVLAVFLFFLKNGYDKTKELFAEELGMDESKAQRQYSFLKNDVGQCHFIRQICLLNPSAKTRQLELLKKWYVVNADVVNTYVYDIEYDEKTVKEELDKLNKEEISLRNELVHKLFKIAILDDGIHNDEWNLLMEMMTKFKLNKNYIAYFKKRYGPLRTEFDEDEKTSSTNSNTVATNNPYYAILGLNDGATDDEIKRAYHSLALQHHPDLPKNADRKDECEKIMAKINEAYEKVRG